MVMATRTEASRVDGALRRAVPDAQRPEISGGCAAPDGGAAERAVHLDTLAWLPALLQTTDAGFPTGAYAHSFGFEEAVRLGLVGDEATLGDFLRDHVVPALADFELPYLRFVWTTVTTTGKGNTTAIVALDAEVGAGKLARETREGSATLGGRRLRALRLLFPADAWLAALAADVAAGALAGHHVTVCAFGAVTAGVPLHAALLAYFYGNVAGVCTAAPKLLRIGAEGCQRVLTAAGREAQGAVARSLQVAREDAGWFDPLLEIASMRHERAAERLFIS